MSFNPFPGPQPYRASDRKLFFGREEAAKKLTNSILANRCLTLFGPSGSGKSSLMQAKVIPDLEEEHDFRCVWVEGWPSDQSPLRWLLDAIYSQLRLGEPPPRGEVAAEALDTALELAERRSDRPILIYLDQLEQLLYTSRNPKELTALLTSIGRIVDAQSGEARVVLSMREDYLGRFRDRARGKKRLLEHGYRLGPLTVGEMTFAVRKAAEKGDPPQDWSHEQVWNLMLDVRMPGESATDSAEIQAAYAQIVCRALFAARDQNIQHGSEVPVPDARVILDRYLDTTLAGLGELRDTAMLLLEEHMIAADGSRTLLTEREAHAAVSAGGLTKVLETLEAAAILRAEEHQGGRYFELGHDWLAKKVHDLKLERAEARRAQKLEEERRAELERAQRVQKQSRRMVAAAVAITLFTGMLGLIALRQSVRAHLLGHLSAAGELAARGQPAFAAKLLLEIEAPHRVRGWDALALDALTANYLKAIFQGHEEGVTRAAFSPDGKRVATASLDGTARIFRSDGRGDPILLAGHERALYELAWDRAGERLVTASKDKTARLWSADGRSLAVLGGHRGPVISASFSPDGTQVLTASSDGVLRIFSADGKNPAREMETQHPLRSAAFSPAGDEIVATGERGYAQIWSADGRPLKSLSGHHGIVYMAAFSPDGRHVVTAAEDKKARVFAVEGAGAPIALEVHTAEVYFAAWSPDSVAVATVSEDRTACVWRPFDPQVPLPLIGHEGAVVHAAWSPDGQTLITASSDNTARIWRPHRRGEGTVLRGHTGRVVHAMISPDNEGALTASFDGTARVWARSGRGRLPVLRGHRGPIKSVSYDLQGKHLLTASEDGTVRTWTVEGAPLATFSAGAHRDPFHAAAFSPDGKFIAAAGEQGKVRIWDTTKPAGEEMTISLGSVPVLAVAWSPDGRRLAAGSGSGAVWMFSLGTSDVPVELGRHEGEVHGVAWSPDGFRVASGGRDAQARVWRIDNPGIVVARLVHRGAVNSVAFSGDGREIVTASSDRRVRVWSSDGAGEPRIIGEHTDTAYFAAWSPSGKAIISTGEDNTARIWNLENRGDVRVEEHKAAVRSAAMNPTEEVLATASDDDQVRLWELDIEVLLDRLRTSSTICLQPAMRMRYLDESLNDAKAEYERCEAAYERTPYYPRLD